MSSFDICEDVWDRIEWTLDRPFFEEDVGLVLLCLLLPVELFEVIRRIGSAFGTLAPGVHVE